MPNWMNLSKLLKKCNFFAKINKLNFAVVPDRYASRSDAGGAQLGRMRPLGATTGRSEASPKGKAEAQTNAMSIWLCPGRATPFRKF